MACDILPPDGGALKVPGGGLLIAGGLVVPADGSTGYSSGCVFHHIDGAAGTMLYLNEGTVNSCAFKKVTTSARFTGFGSLSAVASMSSAAGADTVDLTTISNKIEELVGRVNSITSTLSVV